MTRSTPAWQDCVGNKKRSAVVLKTWNGVLERSKTEKKILNERQTSRLTTPFDIDRELCSASNLPSSPFSVFRENCGLATYQSHRGPIAVFEFLLGSLRLLTGGHCSGHRCRRSTLTTPAERSCSHLTGSDRSRDGHSSTW